MEQFRIDTRRMCAQAKGYQTAEDFCCGAITPQGIEYLYKFGESVRTFRACDATMRVAHGLYVDVRGEVFAHDGINNGFTKVLLIGGDSDLKIVANNPECPYTILVLHQAKVTVEASNYTVVKVYGKAETVNDGTAIINQES